MTALRAAILLVVSQLLLVATTADALNLTCGDGVICEPLGEECDDANNVSMDGCSGVCTIEAGWCCGRASVPSECAFVLFDLNELDGLNVTDGTPVEVFSTSMRFLNPNEFIVCDDRVPWDNISVVIMNLEGGDATLEEIDVDIASAVEEGRIESNASFLEDGSVYLLAEFTENEELEMLLGQQILSGIEISRGPLVDEHMFAEIIFNSLSYEVTADTLFQARNICIVVTAGIYSSSGCVSLSFVGNNDDNPVITYKAASMTFFFEDHPNPVHVINGTIEVSDPDNSVYLLQSAEAKIIPYNPENPSEVLDFSYLSENLSSNFNSANGLLTVSGSATPEIYTEVFENLTYENFKMEPLPYSRTIELTVNDGMHTSEPVDVIIVVININDVPNVVASQQLLTVYYEGNGTIMVDPFIQVVDFDPNVLIMRLEITLAGAVDGIPESIAVSTTAILGPNITVNSSNSYIMINGSGTPDQYTQLLRTLEYTHEDSGPGNPTVGNRTLNFSVMDETSEGTTSYTFYVESINDAPSLYFSTPPVNLKQLTYSEDDPYLPLADDVILEDVDTDIVQVTVQLSGLLNKEHDVFSLNVTLANEYGVDIIPNFTSDGVTGMITLNGSASAEYYEQILKSFAYINSFTNNSVSNGVRQASFYALDSLGSSSDVLTVHIDVTERNDEPDVQIDETIQYTEGTPSIEIVTLHLIDIMDEELNSVSKLNVTLVATNGELDPLDKIFVRSPFEFILFAKLIDNQLLLEMEGTYEEYEEVLRAIRYVNQEDEPTFYANVTTREILQREVIIALTDNNATHPSVAIHRIMINLTLINDNSPVIVINTTNTTCLAAPPMNSLQKRDISAVGPISAKFHRRRLQLKRNSAKAKGKLHAPKVLSAYAQHSKSDNCLANITVTFNSNTSTPPVEVQRDLEELLFLEPSTLHAIPHYGWWINHRTLVIKFDGCFFLEHGDQIYIFFEEQSSSGSCNATSTCLAGICYHNATGCPLHGPTIVATNYTLLPASASPSPISYEAEWDFALLGPYMIVAGGLVLLLSAIATVACLKTSRNPQHTKHKQYHQKPSPSKRQMNLHVETITACTETTSHQEEPKQLNQHQLSNPPTIIMPDEEKTLEFIKISPNERKNLSDGKRVKKRKSVSPPKKVKSEEDKKKETQSHEEANKNKKEVAEEIETNPPQYSLVTNDVLSDLEEECGKGPNMSAGITTIGQFENTQKDGHQHLHPDAATPPEYNGGVSLSATTEPCHSRNKHECASPKAQVEHTSSSGSKQKQSLATSPTKLDLHCRDKSHS